MELMWRKTSPTIYNCPQNQMAKSFSIRPKIKVKIEANIASDNVLFCIIVDVRKWRAHRSLDEITKLRYGK